MTASRNQLCALQSLMRKSKLHKPVFRRSIIDEARADVAQAERVRARAASGQPGVNKLQRRKMRLVDLKSSTSQTVDGEASTQATPQEWHTQSVDREATVDEKFQRAVVARAARACVLAVAAATTATHCCQSAPRAAESPAPCCGAPVPLPQCFRPPMARAVRMKLCPGGARTLQAPTETSGREQHAGRGPQGVQG